MPTLGFNTDKENVMYAVHDLFSEQHFGKKVQINNTEYYLLINKESDSWMAFNTATQNVEQITLSEATQCSQSEELPTLVGMLSEALLKLQGQRDELSESNRKTSNKLEEVRQYAIDRHHQGEICRDGSDQFLEHFGMEPDKEIFQCQVRIEATASIRSRDPEAAVARLQYLLDGVAYSGHENADELAVTMDSLDIEVED